MRERDLEHIRATSQAFDFLDEILGLRARLAALARADGEQRLGRRIQAVDRRAAAPVRRVVPEYSVIEGEVLLTHDPLDVEGRAVEGDRPQPGLGLVLRRERGVRSQE